MRVGQDIVRRGSFYALPTNNLETDLRVIHDGIRSRPGYIRIRSTFEFSGSILKWEVVDRPIQVEKPNA